ncbi:VOC family protein [Pikeienuella sp. HZG-20]|uniref:VOC family protein n=1 Tax=Paludibacillus litoralis TaxID=3133267 RepID=UPI0030EBBAF5
MRQQISVITLGVEDLARARRFYEAGFGWTPVFESDEIIFFQMNGFVLALWMRASLAADSARETAAGGGACALAHNVAERDEVQAAMDRLARAGGRVTREADAPPHGGLRGYVSDPDGHSWEIAWNPAWPIDADGRVTFKL